MLNFMVKSPLDGSHELGQLQVLRPTCPTEGTLPYQRHCSTHRRRSAASVPPCLSEPPCPPGMEYLYVEDATSLVGRLVKVQ